MGCLKRRLEGMPSDQTGPSAGLLVRELCSADTPLDIMGEHIPGNSTRLQETELLRKRKALREVLEKRATANGSSLKSHLARRSRTLGLFERSGGVDVLLLLMMWQARRCTPRPMRRSASRGSLRRCSAVLLRC